MNNYKVSNELMIDFINEIQNFVNMSNVSFLNSGGCGFFALYAYELFASKGINIEIHLIHENKQSFDEKKKECEYPSCAHIVLKFGNIYFDSKNHFKSIKKTRWRNYEFVGTYTDVELKKSLEKVHNWNCMYDRRQNKELRRAIKVGIESIISYKKMVA